MRSPIRWYGGKGNIAKYILPLMPTHICFCEVFGGGASLLFAKQPSRVEIYNDVDSAVVQFFRVFQDIESFKHFKHKCFYTPYSRKLFYEYRDTWQQQSDPIEKVYRWFIVQKMAFNAMFHNPIPSFYSHDNKANNLKNTVDMLDSYVERLRSVQIENDTWDRIIDRYDTTTTLFYIDPPYLPSTRKSKDMYVHEMSSGDHEKLVDKLKDVTGKVLLSGYPNTLYNSLGWRQSEMKTVATSVARKGNEGNKNKQRVECLWYNYEIQPTLF